MKINLPIGPLALSGDPQTNVRQKVYCERRPGPELFQCFNPILQQISPQFDVIRYTKTPELQAAFCCLTF